MEGNFLMTAKVLGPIGAKFLTGRGLSEETLVRYGIYTASRGDAGETVPAANGNIVVFPFEERGAVVAEKYRGKGKQFWQRQGGRRTFWNSDTLDDPALAEGRYPLIITEGEIDALTAIDCGFPFTVSVPDGAPPVPEGKLPSDLEPIDANAEGSGKFEFLWNNRERLKAVKRFVIAVDNDAPGQRLAAELVRRLSASRCLFVEYPSGCKDLNDVLMRHGPEAVAAVLNGARPYPVRGLYRLSDYPDLPEVHGYSMGWPTLDRHAQIFPGEFMVITGVPSHGKSSFVLNVVVNLAERYGWQSAVFSPEMPTVPHLRDKLRRMVLRRQAGELEVAALAGADAWIDRHIVFIDADPTGRDDQDFDLDWLIDRATDAVLRDGIRVLVLDPWNEVEQARRSGESTTEYIARGIRALKRFARSYDVAVVVVAHPTKDIVDRNGKARPVTLYDISDSAAWFNKADHGIVISRGDGTDAAFVNVAKVRFEETGERGSVKMRYDRFSARFEMLGEDRIDEAEEAA
jgi:twinkle protein